ncbi:helix-turn-helix domain-containing protein [Phenylobacterium sp.]|uniref:helix-turn-helix domain-containing protein n=1 Tax=Phenylobacterium sp. TaxID=1871053 RepID=UPI0035ADE3EA
MSLTPEACRAGRALLGWSMRDLAERAGISLGAVNRLEGGETASREGTAAKITAALAVAGVDIVAGDDRTGAVLVYARRRA